MKTQLKEESYYKTENVSVLLRRKYDVVKMAFKHKLPNDIEKFETLGEIPIHIARELFRCLVHVLNERESTEGGSDHQVFHCTYIRETPLSYFLDVQGHGNFSMPAWFPKKVVVYDKSCGTVSVPNWFIEFKSKTKSL